MPAPIRIASALALTALLGCNEGASVGGRDADPHAPDAFAVRGAVTFENNPVSGELTFTPAEGGGTPVKVPLENGSYEATLPQGKYKVAVTGKAGDADLPADLSVERVVRPDTAGQSLSLTLPEENPENHEDLAPEEVRELPASGSTES